MYLDRDDAERATRYTDWTALLHAGEGTTFPVMVSGEAVTAEVVQVTDHEDSDNDRDLSVVVKIEDQFFENTGYGEVGSRYYGDYDPSWYGVKEVRPVQKTVTYYEV